jgi:hypothetical protein
MLAKISLETRAEMAGRSPVAGRPLFLSTNIAFFIIIVYTKSKPRGRVKSSAPDRVERAIADDLAFLAAHPVRQSNRRSAKAKDEAPAPITS